MSEANDIPSDYFHINVKMSSGPSGLVFTHSPKIDPLRKHCSIATIQSDPRGHFVTIIEQIKKAGNYENVLLQLAKLEDDLEILKYVANLEGMGMFAPKPIHHGKDNALSENLRLEGNEHFKKGNFKKSFESYSVSVMKAPYPDTKDGEGTVSARFSEFSQSKEGMMASVVFTNPLKAGKLRSKEHVSFD